MQFQLERISKAYKVAENNVAAVRDVDLSLAAGDFIALCGPSGCGKSTLLLIAGGLLEPDQGRVLADGQDVYRMTSAERARFRAATHGFVFQQFHLVPYLSVLDNVLAARLGLPKQGSPQAIKARADALLERLNLTARRHHFPGQLSTGEKQRTALARALLNEPKILLADEPTGNLDRAHAEQVMGYLKDFAEQGGIVVLVTHDAWAASQAQRIQRMQAGRLVAEESLLASDRIPSTGK